MTVCPFCLTIFWCEDEDCDCPVCHVGILISWDDYVLRMNASFIEGNTKETYTDDWLK
jgi:hypothetical protein